MIVRGPMERSAIRQPATITSGRARMAARTGGETVCVMEG